MLSADAGLLYVEYEPTAMDDGSPVRPQGGLHFHGPLVRLHLLVRIEQQHRVYRDGRCYMLLIAIVGHVVRPDPRICWLPGPGVGAPLGTVRHHSVEPFAAVAVAEASEPIFL